MTQKPRTLTQIVRENAGDDMRLERPIPPLVIVKGRVCCDRCSTSHEPINRYDTHPQCPYCGTLIDLTATKLLEPQPAA